MKGPCRPAALLVVVRWGWDESGRILGWRESSFVPSGRDWSEHFFGDPILVNEGHGEKTHPQAASPAPQTRDPSHASRKININRYERECTCFLDINLNFIAK